MQLRSLLYRLCFGPRALGIALCDRWVNPWLVRVAGAEVGPGCRFLGLPTIRAHRGALVRLGARVTVHSRWDSNALGLAHPTVLAAMEAGARVEVGEGSSLSGASIVARQAVVIGREVMVGADACVWDSDFHPLDPAARRRHPTREARSAPIEIEDEVFIGARALVLKGVRIGRGAVIGAGAVVTRDVAPYTIVAGNPARPVGRVPGSPTASGDSAPPG